VGTLLVILCVNLLIFSVVSDSMCILPFLLISVFPIFILTLGSDLTNHPRFREGGDDEQEFQFLGIPIAGENKGDSDEDWYSDDSQQDEHKDLHTNNCTTASINVPASVSLAFQVSPAKDGHVMIRTHTPIPYHPNPYQILDEEPLFQPPSQKTLVSWSDTCVAEFQRHLPYTGLTAVTTAQRLAHPWKTRRQEKKNVNVNTSTIQ
jgi:hypothetical protein